MAFFLLRPSLVLMLILLALVLLVPSVFGGQAKAKAHGLVTLEDARLLTRLTQQLIRQMELKAKESVENDKEWKETILNVLS
jgi:ABC-type transport system involved in cytochrome bd biosynthesis fused ATPase/permease subunit